jgi:tetratricopeptide (TPR) repeat protein
MEPDEFIDKLDNALEGFEFAEAHEMVSGLDPSDFQDKHVKKALGLLRRKQRFSDLEAAAHTFSDYGKDNALVSRQRAQALIDQGRVDQALKVLGRMDQEVDDSDPEKPEVRGLLGRGFKQKYVDQGGADHLRAAIEAYERGWKERKGDYRWHGINVVALLNRAGRDAIDTHSELVEKQVAEQILREIDDLDQKALVWDYGTAMEASLALGREKDALKWAKQYVRHPAADAFELGSTLRQLKEVWQIKKGDVGGSLIPVIESELLQRRGGSITLAPDDARDINEMAFEAVYGPEGYVRLTWMENIFKASLAIVRIRHKNTGEAYGTGFVVAGEELHSDWGNDLVMLTNSHVVSDYTGDVPAVNPQYACAEFTRMPGKPCVALGEKLFHSPRNELDAWICQIKPPEEVAPLDLSFDPPLVAQPGDRPQRIFVIGHPLGGDMAISMFDNDLVGYEGPYVHYRSPTEGGSSGSPVLTRDLATFALHHGALKELEANEGVLLREIRNSI